MRANTPTSISPRWLIRTFVLALALFAGTAVPASADMLSLVPNGDGTPSGSAAPEWTTSGCTSQYQCIDEYIPDTVNDADYIELPTGSLAPRAQGFQLTDATLPAGSIITSARVNIRAQRQASGSCNINSIYLRDSPTNAYLTWGATSYPTGSPGVVTASLEFLAEPASNIPLNDLYITFNMDQCPEGYVRVYAMELDIEYQPPPTATLLPNQQWYFSYPSWAANGLGYASEDCLSPNTWECIDEVIPSGVVPGTYIYSNSANYVRYGFSTAAVGIVGRAGLRVLGDADATVDLAYDIRTTGNTSLAAADLPMVTANRYFSEIGNRYLTQTNIDDLEVILTSSSNTNRRVRAMSIDVWAATVTGSADNTSICDGVTPVIGIAVNSVRRDVVPCQSGTGNFAAVPTFATGDTITVYYDGVAGGMANAGATWVKAGAASTTAITGVPLTRQRYRVEARAPGTPITYADMAQFGQAQDPDIYAQLTSQVMVGDPGAIFEVGLNTFQPGANIDVYALWVRSGATLAPTSFQVSTRGSGTGTCSNAVAGQPFCIAGTFTPGTSTVGFFGTSDLIIPGGSYYNLGASPITSSSNTFRLGHTNGATLNIGGILSLSGSGGAPQYSTSNYSPTINVAGTTLVSGTATLGGSGTGTMTIGGDLTGAGDVNFTAGTVALSANGAVNTNLAPTGTLPGTAWQFATLRTQNTGFPQRTITVPASAREIRVSTLLSAELYADLNASATTQPITVTGNVSIAFGTSITSPPVFEVHGNFVNSGTFYNGSNTVRFAGVGTSNINFNVGAFHHIDIATPGKIVQMQSNFTVNGTLTSAGTCASPVVLRSDVGGTARQLTKSGGGSISYVSVRDINVASGTITASNSGNLGNTSGITFTGTGCAAPTSMFLDALNASSGSANPTMLDARGAFHSSSVDTSGAALDRYRAEVLSSRLDANVRALFPLNGTGADRSSVGATVTATGGATYATGATADFGQAASFDGVDDQMSAPSNAAYTSSTFTVDLWFRSNGGTSNFPTMVSRSGSGQMQFQIGFNRANKTLVADLTTGNGMFEVATPWAPWIDNAWHHVALTVDGSKAMRLYVDGQQYGSTVTYTGTLHTPSAPIYIGGTQGFASNAYGGLIDDVQFANVVRTPAEIAGYAKTNRPHAWSIWQSAGFGTATGAALGATCSASSRCADILYGGASLQREGARYFMTHQFRTTAGIWTDTASDWFETRDGIVVTAPGTVALGSVVGSGTATANFSTTTTCTNGSGCILQLSTPSDGIGLSNAAGTATVPLMSTGAPATWATGGAAGLGFTVLGSTTGKDTATWGTGTDFSNLALLKFTGAGMGGVTLKQSSAAGSEVTNVGVRLDAGMSTVASYTGTVDLVAIDAP